MFWKRTPRGPFIAPKGPITIAPPFTKLAGNCTVSGAPERFDAPLDRVRAPLVQDLIGTFLLLTGTGPIQCTTGLGATSASRYVACAHWRESLEGGPVCHRTVISGGPTIFINKKPETSLFTYRWSDAPGFLSPSTDPTTQSDECATEPSCRQSGAPKQAAVRAIFFIFSPRSFNSLEVFPMT
jgi:hypothetical protein